MSPETFEILLRIDLVVLRNSGKKKPKTHSIICEVPVGTGTGRGIWRRAPKEVEQWKVDHPDDLVLVSAVQFLPAPKTPSYNHLLSLRVYHPFDERFHCQRGERAVLAFSSEEQPLPIFDGDLTIEWCWYVPAEAPSDDLPLEMLKAAACCWAEAECKKLNQSMCESSEPRK